MSEPDNYRLKAYRPKALQITSAWVRSRCKENSALVDVMKAADVIALEYDITAALAEATLEAMERAARIASSQVVDGKYCVSVAEAIRKEMP